MHVEQAGLFVEAVIVQFDDGDPASGMPIDEPVFVPSVDASSSSVN